MSAYSVHELIIASSVSARSLRAHAVDREVGFIFSDVYRMFGHAEQTRAAIENYFVLVFRYFLRGQFDFVMNKINTLYLILLTVRECYVSRAFLKLN